MGIRLLSYARNILSYYCCTVAYAFFFGDFVDLVDFGSVDLHFGGFVHPGLADCFAAVGVVARGFVDVGHLGAWLVIGWMLLLGVRLLFLLRRPKVSFSPRVLVCCIPPVDNLRLFLF